jgi:hypothetical protein
MKKLTVETIQNFDKRVRDVFPAVQMQKKSEQELVWIDGNKKVAALDIDLNGQINFSFC